MRFLRASLLVFALGAITLVGCEKDKREEEIVVEDVTYPDREPMRLRAGCIKRDDVIWFFRILGPTNEVGKHVAEFDDFVRSVKFVAKVDQKGEKYEDATWTQPKDWRQDPKGGMRYAAFRIAAHPKELEVTVTRLPVGDGWLRSNVIRWQKIVNQPPVQDAAALEELVKRENDIVWVDLQGLGVHVVSKPPAPMAVNPNKLPFQMPARKNERGPAKSPFIYVVPDGWKQGRTNEIVVDRYTIGNDVQVSLTSAGGDLTGNVNRWRGEVGLSKDLDAAEIARMADVIRVAGQKAYSLDISNPAGPPAKNRSLVVMIPMERSNWFIKMWGPRESVEANKQAFQTFVKSFKLDVR